MALGSDIAAVLMSTLDLLRHQTSPAQHTLLTPDERKAALQQLLATVEAATKLADVAYLDAVAVAVAAQRNAGGADAARIMAETERFKAEAAKIGKEVAMVVAETERTRALAEKVRSDTEPQTAARAPPAAATAAAACSTPLGRPVVSPRPALAVETMPGSFSLTDSASLDCPETTVIALYTSHIKVTRIMHELAKWNRNHIEKYTPADWAWFRHSVTEAFLILNCLGAGEITTPNAIRDRTGTIKLPGYMRSLLDTHRGYGGFIHGRTRENGKRDSAKFKFPI
ncbi:hypothetical protein DFP73DRAFT_285632 [Morchella snyderi]|nr:hypothetical protein DFP73DRAFT_285632 [Morchella snyderi]